jgi:hypothetical protein
VTLPGASSGEVHSWSLALQAALKVPLRAVCVEN